jgi:plasmid maintenance system antidote protein VapI
MVSGERVTSLQIAQRMGWTINVARNRVWRRAKLKIPITWESLSKSLRKKARLRVKMPHAPAAQFLREIMVREDKSIQWVVNKMRLKSNSYVRHILAGQAPITPEYASRFAEVLMLDADEEKKLNIAGARQAGWDV